MNLLVDPVLAGEQQVRREAADDHVRCALLLLDTLEETTARELDAHRLEIRSARARNAHARRLGSPGLDATRRDEPLVRAFVERQSADVPDGLDARQCGEPI